VVIAALSHTIRFQYFSMPLPGCAFSKIRASALYKCLDAWMRVRSDARPQPQSAEISSRTRGHTRRVIANRSELIVDIYAGWFVQAGFTLLGLMLLVHATGQTSFVGPTLFEALALLAFALLFCSPMGMFGFVGLSFRVWPVRPMAMLVQRRRHFGS